MFTVQFWKAAAERAIKTAAQVGILAILAGATTIGDQAGFDIRTVDWGSVAAFAAGGAFLSILTSIGSDFVGQPGPSLGAENLPEL